MMRMHAREVAGLDLVARARDGAVVPLEGAGIAIALVLACSERLGSWPIVFAAVGGIVRGTAVSGHVRELVLGELRSGNPGLAFIAEKLHISARTLRRRLAAEGTTHQEIVDDLRRELADRYLLDEGLAVSKVAVLLGFSNASAFHRAFKRWFGTSPHQHRRAL